jgi:SSS family solute:Na+ symporter
MNRTLNALQVAALLVSASYGIGFLFGSGEMAMTHGMAASIYGLATALGMLLLALFAARVWRSGKAIWDVFGAALGERIKRAVALLSVIWMAGVLAAQIHGGVATVKLLGLPTMGAYALVLTCILLASRLRLGAASTVFSLFLIASGMVLVLALIHGRGGAIYQESLQRLIADAPSLGVGAMLSISVAVAALVCTGADYHQFLLAARRDSGAVWGCLIASGCLIAISFLPASVVLGFKETGSLANLHDAKQVIPFILNQEVGHLGAAISTLVLIGLSAAALGSGAAITRAMADALNSAVGGTRAAGGIWTGIVALGTATALTARGQGIVATMVSVNVIYICSIAVVFAALMANWRLNPSEASLVMGVGFTASLGVYLAHWAGVHLGDGDLASLMAGLLASGSVFLAFAVLGKRSKPVVRPVPRTR